MASYRLLIKPSAAKEIESAPKKDRLLIIKRIQDHSIDPRSFGCKKLSGHDDRYRIRQGAYRIVDTISDVCFVICIVKLGHRKEVPFEKHLGWVCDTQRVSVGENGSGKNQDRMECGCFLVL